MVFPGIGGNYFRLPILCGGDEFSEHRDEGGRGGLRNRIFSYGE